MNRIHKQRLMERDDGLVITRGEVGSGRGQINEWDYIKLNSFCLAKEIVNKVKRQPSEWENIFARNASGKGLYPKCAKNS